MLKSVEAIVQWFHTSNFKDIEKTKSYYVRLLICFLKHKSKSDCWEKKIFIGKWTVTKQRYIFSCFFHGSWSEIVVPCCHVLHHVRYHNHHNQPNYVNFHFRNFPFACFWGTLICSWIELKCQSSVRYKTWWRWTLWAVKNGGVLHLIGLVPNVYHLCLASYHDKCSSVPANTWIQN